MSRYSGYIGVSVGKEVDNVYIEDIIEFPVTGNVKDDWRYHNIGDDSMSKDLIISNRIEIIPRRELLRNLDNIRYITYLSSKWEVRVVAYNKPKLILSLGGVYNGQK